MNAILDSENYIPDVPLKRSSLDTQHSDYGTQFSNVCKATGLRICNVVKIIQVYLDNVDTTVILL